MVFQSQSTVSLRGCRPPCELRWPWTWRTLSPAKDQALVTQAISNHVRSLIAAHLADINSSDAHTIDVQSDRGYRFCGWNKAGLNYLCISEGSAIALAEFEDEVREHTHL